MSPGRKKQINCEANNLDAEGLIRTIRRLCHSVAVKTCTGNFAMKSTAVMISSQTFMSPRRIFESDLSAPNVFFSVTPSLFEGKKIESVGEIYDDSDEWSSL